MKRKTISILAFTAIATVTLSACTKAKVLNDNQTPAVNNVYTETVAMPEISSLKPEFIALLDEYYKSGKKSEDILNSEDKTSVLYSSALYVKLKEFGLDDDTIKMELFNVINFGLVHPSADGWKNDLLVKHLNESLDYSTDAIVYYYPLAAYVHLFSCKDEHTVVEGRIKCDKIENDLMEMNDNILFANYVVENVLALEDNDPLKVALMRIINSGQDVETCIYELENIFKLAVIPRCASEEEWALISHLDATTDEMENPFEVYYDLAVFVHTLHHEEEHYKNEFGQWECNTVRQEMESGMSLGK